MNDRTPLAAAASKFTLAAALALAAPIALAPTGCRPDGDEENLRGMQMTAASLPLSPTNMHADDPAAAALGQKLFFDRRMSADGTIGCVSCHDPAHGFSDPKRLSIGVRGQLGTRHSMTVLAAAFHPFALWDGKADSLWSQPLKALENPLEMDFTRLDVFAFVSTQYRAEYEDVFGAMPSGEGLPARGKPGDAAWDALAAERKDAVQRVFSNVGKAIEAYERKVLCVGTRFDRWAAGQGELSESELNGARLFDARHCARCHSGPSFSDGAFHDLGLAAGDPGRAAGITSLVSDVFNGAGAYSDDPTAGAAKVAAAKAESATTGAFRTASLRGSGQRTFFGHTGEHQRLEDFIVATYRRGRGGARGDGDRADGVDPLLDGVVVDRDEVGDLVAFLRTLDCPAQPTGATP